MTTKVTIDAHAGWPVQVTPIGSGARARIIAPGEVAEFVIFAGQDLLIHEVQKAEDIGADHMVGEPMLRHFGWGHLPSHLQVVSAPFGIIAHDVAARLPRSAERSACLRKLLEAKDCAVRAAVEARTAAEA